jgi:hypothetical protein
MNIKNSNIKPTDEEEQEEKKKKKNNDIREIRTIRQLEKVNLDFDSPRLKEAMNNLGISIDECQNKEKSDFEKRGVD